jgi:protein subunit release factor A
MINLDSLKRIKDRYQEIQVLMSRSEVATDVARMTTLGREHVELKEVVEAIVHYEELLAEEHDLDEIISSAPGISRNSRPTWL